MVSLRVRGWDSSVSVDADRGTQVAMIPFPSSIDFNYRTQNY